MLTCVQLSVLPNEARARVSLLHSRFRYLQIVPRFSSHVSKELVQKKAVRLSLPICGIFNRLSWDQKGSISRTAQHRHDVPVYFGFINNVPHLRCWTDNADTSKPVASTECKPRRAFRCSGLKPERTKPSRPSLVPDAVQTAVRCKAFHTGTNHSRSPTKSFPQVPLHLQSPPTPRRLDTALSIMRELLTAMRDASDLFLPLKASLVGLLKVWDVCEARAVHKRIVGTMKLTGNSGLWRSSKSSSNSPASFRHSAQLQFSINKWPICTYSSDLTQLQRAFGLALWSIIETDGTTITQRPRSARTGNRGEARSQLTRSGDSVAR